MEKTKQVFEKLKEVASKRGTIAYEDLMEEFGIPRGHHTPGIGIGHVVGEISNMCFSKGFPMLSAIVVRKGSDMPGIGIIYPGLDGIPENLKRNVSELEEDQILFIRKEQERVWNFDWSSVSLF